jgi:hypothetical protein
MPFNADVDKTQLGPPQTLTGFAASENSKYIVPELYLNGGFTPLAVNSVAKRFNADGTLEKVPGVKNPDKEFDAIYKLIKDEETGHWKWELIE